MGNSYIELGNYEKSRHLLEECLKIYQKDPSIFPEHHDSVARTLSYLGKVYTNIKEYEKARILLEKSLIIYQENFGKTHLETAYVLSSLGKLDFSENKFNSAEEFFQKALEIFQTNKHPESYKTLESLADLYMKKSTDELNNGNLQKSKNLQIKATNHLEQALEVIKIHFPEDSPNLKKIQEKIKSYENG